MGIVGTLVSLATCDGVLSQSQIETGEIPLFFLARLYYKIGLHNRVGFSPVVYTSPKELLMSCVHIRLSLVSVLVVCSLLSACGGGSSLAPP